MTTGELRVCAATGCGQAIPPERSSRARYCSERCQKREKARRWRAANPEKKRERSRKYNPRWHTTPHGRAYRALQAAIYRCHVPETAGYADNYGGQGVEVHPRYRDGLRPRVDTLIADIGLPGPTDQLDRIHGGTSWYAPGGVRWASPRDNALNRSSTRWLTHEGRTMCISDWARELNIHVATLHARLKAGWPVERALSTPAMSRQEALATRAPEQRSEIAKRANAALSPEQRFQIKQKAWATRRARAVPPQVPPAVGPQVPPAAPPPAPQEA